MSTEEIAVKLLANLSEQLNDEDNENYINLKEIDLTDFFHALSNIVPSYVYNKYTGSDKNNLEFNHIANQLCFQFSKIE